MHSVGHAAESGSHKLHLENAPPQAPAAVGEVRNG
jgi:hypothetical protein